MAAPCVTATCQAVLSSPHLQRCDDICPTEVDLRDGSDSDKREANRRALNLLCRPGIMAAPKSLSWRVSSAGPPLLQRSRSAERAAFSWK